jgi:hypothetical protein
MGKVGINGKWSKEQLSEALQRVRGDESVRKVSRETGIPKTTILRYEVMAAKRPRDDEMDSCLEMEMPRKKIMGRPTILRESEEDILVDKVLQWADSNMPISRRNLMQMANEVLLQRTGHDLRGVTNVGEQWARGFLRRHRVLSLRIAEALDESRARNTAENIASEHMDRIEHVLEEKRLWSDRNRIWNVDETGLRLGESTNQKVLARRGSRRVYQITSKDTRHVSVLFAVNAAGAASPPVFLLPYKRVPEAFVARLPKPDWGVICTGSGWITEESFLQWLMSFVHYLDGGIRTDPAEEHLLIMDQHASHCSMRVFEFAQEHNVCLFFLPPHTTHYLQPVDVSLFKPVKQAYHAAERELAVHGRQPTIDCIPILFQKAWAKAGTPANITAGFARTGICPFDRDVVISLVQPHVPPSLSEDEVSRSDRMGFEERDTTTRTDEQEMGTNSVNEVYSHGNLDTSTTGGRDVPQGNTKQPSTRTRRSPVLDGLVTVERYKKWKEDITRAREEALAEKEKKKREKEERKRTKAIKKSNRKQIPVTSGPAPPGVREGVGHSEFAASPSRLVIRIKLHP